MEQKRCGKQKRIYCLENFNIKTLARKKKWKKMTKAMGNFENFVSLTRKKIFFHLTTKKPNETIPSLKFRRGGKKEKNEEKGKKTENEGIK